MNYDDIMKTASGLVGERGKQYGNLDEQWARVATIASAVLGREFTPYDLVTIMYCVKLSRIAEDPSHIDSHLDAINYQAFALHFAPTPKCPVTKAAEAKADLGLPIDFEEIERELNTRTAGYSAWRRVTLGGADEI